MTGRNRLDPRWNVWLGLGLIAMILSGITAKSRAEAWNLSVEGFVQELVFSQASPRTPRFDAYASNSFQLRVPDLLGALDRSRNTEGWPIDAVLVIGPYGPIEAYDITLFLHDGGTGCRVNRLRYQHQRILLKETRRTGLEDCRRFTEKVSSVSKPKTQEAASPSEPVVSLGRWSGDSLDIRTLDSEPSKIDPVLAALAALVDGAIVTYAVQLPDGQKIVLIQEPGD